VNKVEMVNMVAAAIREADGDHTLGAGALGEVVVDAMLPVLAGVRSESYRDAGHQALQARDRCRYGSDAWSRLDRIANDMFALSRVWEKGSK
jgi:hypothetical protein